MSEGTEQPGLILTTHEPLNPGHQVATRLQTEYFSALPRNLPKPTQSHLQLSHLSDTEYRYTPGYSQWGKQASRKVSAGRPAQADPEAWVAWTKPAAHGSTLSVGSENKVTRVTLVLPPPGSMHAPPLQVISCPKAWTYRERLPLERLQDEVADDPPVVHVHARPERVEDSRHSHFHTFLQQGERR